VGGRELEELLDAADGWGKGDKGKRQAKDSRSVRGSTRSTAPERLLSFLRRTHLPLHLLQLQAAAHTTASANHPSPIRTGGPLYILTGPTFPELPHHAKSREALRKAAPPVHRPPLPTRFRTLPNQHRQSTTGNNDTCSSSQPRPPPPLTALRVCVHSPWR